MSHPGLDILDEYCVCHCTLNFKSRAFKIECCSTKLHMSPKYGIIRDAETNSFDNVGLHLVGLCHRRQLPYVASAPDDTGQCREFFRDKITSNFLEIDLLNLKSSA